MRNLLYADGTAQVHATFSHNDLSESEIRRLKVLALMIGDETRLVEVDGSKFELTKSHEAGKLIFKLVRV